MTKAVFFDVDGTLVSFKTHKISSAVLDALYELQHRGVKVCIASGRPRYLIDNVGDFPFDAFVCMNGGLAIVGDEVVYRQPMDKADAVAMTKLAVERHIPVYLFAEEDSGVNETNEISREIERLLNIKAPSVRDIVKMAEDGPVYEFSTFLDIDQERELLHPLLHNVVYPRWHPSFMDINPRGLSKLVAAKKVLEYFGIDVSEAMAFGDGGNDIELLDGIGTGVVMGNAIDEVKKHADYITDSVDEDGIVTALQHFGLI